jgi:hypothetical protein
MWWLLKISKTKTHTATTTLTAGVFKPTPPLKNSGNARFSIACTFPRSNHDAKLRTEGWGGGGGVEWA